MRTLVRGGTVVSATNSSVADVLIDGEEIVAVGDVGEVDAEVVDATGCYVLPGLIDNHTHMAMPFGGTRSIDDYDTGTRAAAAGRDHVHRRLRDPAGGRRAAVLAGRVAGARGRRRARRLRLPRRDHAGRRGHLRRHAADGRAGHRQLQGLPRLQGRADGHRRPVLPRARDDARPQRADDGPLRERLGDRRAGRARARRRADRPDPPRAHAAGDPRGRGDPPLRPPRRARGRERVHRARDLRAGRRRDRRRPGARRGGVRRDLPAVPDEHGRRPRAPRLRGRPLRLLAAAARGAQPGAAVARAAPRRARERVDRPLPVQQRAEGARPRRLLEDPQRAGDDPAPAREAVGPRRRRRPDHAVGARRPDVFGDRAALRPRAQGRDRTGDGRRPRGLRPLDAVRVLDSDLAHERRLRPVRGRDLVGQRAPHVLPRHAGLRPRRDRHLARPRPLRPALARRDRRRRSRDGRRPGHRRPARAGGADRRARRRPPRVLDRRVGQGARARALEARGAAGRDRDRRGGQRLGRPARASRRAS